MTDSPDGAGVPARLTGFDHDGLRFDVVDSGPLDGDLVVLLHGFPQRATSWAAVSEHLHEAGLRTVALDQRGYSPGARPRGRRAYAMQHLVGDVSCLVERLGGGPVHLVGHDWGAAVAWSTAGAHPELVRTLTAVSVPHPAAMMRALKTRSQARKSWYMGAFQVPLVPERLLSRPATAARFLGSSGMTEPMLATFRREIVEAGALPGGLGYYRAMPFSTSGLGRRVRVPTTHVWSDGDVALGRLGADLTASYVVDAPYSLEVMEGVSHWIPDEQPARLAEIVLERVRSVDQP